MNADEVQRFSRTNTGTFAAQWMVADYNQCMPWEVIALFHLVVSKILQSLLYILYGTRERYPEF